MSHEFVPQDRRRFEAAVRRFDEENARDPHVEVSEGVAHPRELLYAQRLSDWVLRLSPHASEALRLAARCQHLCRWLVPRGLYPMTRTGYLQWREGLKKFHAEKAGAILREVGYPGDVVRRIQALNLKKGFPEDPETRVLEDALCLVFLEHQLSDLASRSTEEKVLNALQKSWRKMTRKARELALGLKFDERERALLEKALSASSQI